MGNLFVNFQYRGELTSTSHPQTMLYLYIIIIIIIIKNNQYDNFYNMISKLR